MFLCSMEKKHKIKITLEVSLNKSILLVLYYLIQNLNIHNKTIK
jgi:hypothetical protein